MFDRKRSFNNFASGELSEWSMEAVLKTVVPKATGGSNPSLSELLVIDYAIITCTFINGEVPERPKGTVC